MVGKIPSIDVLSFLDSVIFYILYIIALMAVLYQSAYLRSIAVG